MPRLQGITAKREDLTRRSRNQNAPWLAKRTPRSPRGSRMRFREFGRSERIFANVAGFSDVPLRRKLGNLCAPFGRPEGPRRRQESLRYYSIH